MSKWSYISSSGVHLIRCQPDPTSHLTKCQTGSQSHLWGFIWPNVNLTLHLIWPNVKVVLQLILGGHLMKCWPDPTSLSTQISTWLDLKPHLGEHIWQNINLILPLLWPNVKLALYLIFGGTSDQMMTWPYIFIWPNIDLNWLKSSYWGAHQTKCQLDPTSDLTKCQSCPTSHLGFDIWSNVNLTLHFHLTKYQSDLTQSLILDGTSDQMSTWPYI